MRIPAFCCPQCGTEIFIVDTKYSHDDNGHMPVYSECECDLNTSIEEVKYNLNQSYDHDNEPF